MSEIVEADRQVIKMLREKFGKEGDEEVKITYNPLSGMIDLERKNSSDPNIKTIMDNPFIMIQTVESEEEDEEEDEENKRIKKDVMEAMRTK